MKEIKIFQIFLTEYVFHPLQGQLCSSSSNGGVGQKRERKNAATKGHLHSSSAGGMLTSSSMSKKPKMLRAVAAHIFS